LDELHKEHIHQPHDKAYKLLLSSKRVFMELLQSFVDRRWVTQVEEATLIKVDKSYILQDFRDRESDVVYRAQLQDHNVIFYVLMELQSSVDFQMPYRLLQYMLEIWRDQLRNVNAEEAGRKGYKLPAIVPIVLYNGSGAWTASRSFRETLDHQEWFGEELLDFKYILIDLNAYSERELKNLSNLISLVFLLERKRDFQELVEQMAEMSDMLQGMSQELFPLFKSWMKIITHRSLEPEQHIRISHVIDEYMEPEEVKNMISNVEKIFVDYMTQGVERGIKQGIEQGIEKGIEKGIEQGIKEGKIEVAKRLLEKGLPVELIIETTDLSAQQIEELKK
jgi:predicted transposase/invertase (TIGR01784 family)